MAYKFYGWKTADVRDSRGLTPRNYYDILSDIWSADTCAPRMRERWSEKNRALGQCSITAFLMQDLYGGKVCGIPMDDGNYHCFNVVGEGTPNVRLFDLTSEQFGDIQLDYSACQEQFREAHFSKAEKKRRYEILRAELMKNLPVIQPVTMAHSAQYGEIYAAAFSGEPWNGSWRTKDAEIHVREILDSKQSYGLEYLIKGEIVGFILGTSMLFHYGRVFEINDLAVLPEYQGRGIAGILLERCRREMKRRGIAGMNLITSGRGFLPQFYERFGFQREDKVILMGMEL